MSDSSKQPTVYQAKVQQTVINNSDNSKTLKLGWIVTQTLGVGSINTNTQIFGSRGKYRRSFDVPPHPSEIIYQASGVTASYSISILIVSTNKYHIVFDDCYFYIFKVEPPDFGYQDNILMIKSDDSSSSIFVTVEDGKIISASAQLINEKVENMLIMGE